PDQLELTPDQGQGLLEDLAAAHGILDATVPLAAKRGAGVLGLDQLAKLLERQAEQLLEPQQLLEPLDVGFRVEAVRTRLAAGGGEQADLLVVADRPGCSAGAPGDPADPDPRLGDWSARAGV